MDSLPAEPLGKPLNPLIGIAIRSTLHKEIYKSIPWNHVVREILEKTSGIYMASDNLLIEKQFCYSYPWNEKVGWISMIL